MHKTKAHRAAALAALALFSLASPLASPVGAAESRAEEESRLIGVLGSDQGVFEKAKACQRLAVVGSEKAIPHLAKLLSDPKLAHYARFGLEPNPSPAVDAALRAAAERLEGLLQVGVLNSIGVRRDAGALGLLIRLMRERDADTAAAAAAAAGRVGTPEAARALLEALAKERGARRTAVARAALQCAERAEKLGRREEARGLFDAVREAKVPGHVRRAGLRGAILLGGEPGLARLAGTLEGKDRRAFNVALLAVRQLDDPGATKTLVAALGDLPPSKKALVLRALGDRGDRAALPAVLEAATKKGPAAVRVAALEALAGVGDASAVRVLMRSAAARQAPVSKAARGALARLRGEGIDEAIVARLSKGPARLRPTAIEIAGERGIRSALPALRAAVDDEAPAVRLAAIRALGAVMELSDLQPLARRLTKPAGEVSEEESEAIHASLAAACRRIPDTDACAEALAEVLGSANAPGRETLFTLFPALGGEKALGVVVEHSRHGEEAARDAASRALGQWPTADAARPLLENAKEAASDGDRARALRDVSELIRRIGMPLPERLARCEEAMALARNADEKKIVLGAYAGVPAPETLKLLEKHLATPGLEDAAARAAVTICERLIRSRKRGAVAPAMRKVFEKARDEALRKKARELLKQAGG